MSELFQESLFKDETRHLHIVKDNEPVELSIDELFDSSVYDELHAITYVSSASFLILKSAFKENIFQLDMPKRKLSFILSLFQEDM